MTGIASGEPGRETSSMLGLRRSVLEGRGVGRRAWDRARGYPRVREGVVLGATREGPASELRGIKSVLDGERRVRLIAQVAIVCVCSIKIC